MRHANSALLMIIGMVCTACGDRDPGEQAGIELLAGQARPALQQGCVLRAADRRSRDPGRNFCSRQAVDAIASKAGIPGPERRSGELAARRSLLGLDLRPLAQP